MQDIEKGTIKTVWGFTAFALLRGSLAIRQLFLPFPQLFCPFRVLYGLFSSVLCPVLWYVLIVAPMCVICVLRSQDIIGQVRTLFGQNYCIFKSENVNSRFYKLASWH